MTRMPHSERFWKLAESETAKAVNARRTGPWMRARAKWFGVDLGDHGGAGGTWRPRGPNVPLVHGRGRGQQITVPPDLSRMAGELMGMAAPSLQGAMDRGLGGLAMEVLKGWPELSKLSRSAIALEYRVENSGQRYIGTIRVDVPYALFIKGGPIHKLLLKPADWVAHRMSVEAAEDISRTAR